MKQGKGLRIQSDAIKKRDVKKQSKKVQKYNKYIAVDESKNFRLHFLHFS